MSHETGGRETTSSPDATKEVSETIERLIIEAAEVTEQSTARAHEVAAENSLSAEARIVLKGFAIDEAGRWRDLIYRYLNISPEQAHAVLAGRGYIDDEK